MKYDEELIILVKNKNFKTFWHCLDYLVIAGYPTIDAFGISLQEFGESRIYSDVAFIRTNAKFKILGRNDTTNRHHYENKIVNVGIIDNTNIHLAGLYSTYRTWLSDSDNLVYPDIEATCEVFTIPELNAFLMDYLLKVSKLHYGFEAFKYKVDKDFIPPNGDRHGYIASMDPATGLYSMEPEINAMRRMQADIEGFQRGLNRNND
jgi:hypothetical protein